MFLLLISYSYQLQLEDDLLNLINGYRRSQGLSTLETQTPLLKAAQNHADFLCVTRRITHAEYMQNKNLSSRLLNLDYVGEKIGENIAKEYGDDVHEVFKVWMTSFHHRENIIGDYDGVGVATCKNSLNERFWAVVFGKSINGKKRSLKNIMDSFSGPLKPGPNDKIVIVVNKNDLCSKDSSRHLEDCSTSEFGTPPSDPNSIGSHPIVINIEDTCCNTPPNVEIPNKATKCDNFSNSSQPEISTKKIEIVDPHSENNCNPDHSIHTNEKFKYSDEFHSGIESNNISVIEILDRRLDKFKDELLKYLSLNNNSLKANHCDLESENTHKRYNHEHTVGRFRNKQNEIYRTTKNTCKDILNDFIQKENEKTVSYFKTQTDSLNNESIMSFSSILSKNDWSQNTSQTKTIELDELITSPDGLTNCAITEYITITTSRAQPSEKSKSHPVSTIYKTITIYDEETKTRNISTISNVNKSRTNEEFHTSDMYKYSIVTETPMAGMSSCVFLTPIFSSETISIQPFLESNFSQSYTSLKSIQNEHEQNQNYCTSVISPNSSDIHTKTKIFKANVEGSFVEIQDPKNESPSSNKDQDEIENTLRDLRNLLNSKISSHNIKIVLSKNSKKNNIPGVEIGESCKLG